MKYKISVAEMYGQDKEFTKREEAWLKKLDQLIRYCSDCQKFVRNNKSKCPCGNSMTYGFSQIKRHKE